MPERTTATQVTQIRPEATLGTDPAAGTKTLGSLGIDLAPNVDVNLFRPSGHKYAGVASVRKDWSTAKVAGPATYQEIVYPLSMLFGNAAITTPDSVGAPSGRQWLWTPSDTAVEDPKSFTVEQGSSVRAAKATGLHATGLALEFDREKVDLSGDMLGQLFTDGITLDAAATALALVPILARQGDVFLDATWAALGTTKLTRLLSGAWSLSDKYGPLWTVNSVNGSWVVPVELVPSSEVTLTLEADATGMGLLTTLRAGGTSFVRYQWTGDIIGAAVRYQLQMDLAVKWTKISELKDQDGVYAVTFTGELARDAATGNVQRIAVVNTLAAL